MTHNNPGEHIAAQLAVRARIEAWFDALERKVDEVRQLFRDIGRHQPPLDSQQPSQEAPYGRN